MYKDEVDLCLSSVLCLSVLSISVSTSLCCLSHLSGADEAALGQQERQDGRQRSSRLRHELPRCAVQVSIHHGRQDLAIAQVGLERGGTVNSFQPGEQFAEVGQTDRIGGSEGMARGRRVGGGRRPRKKRFHLGTKNVRAGGPESLSLVNERHGVPCAANYHLKWGQRRRWVCPWGFRPGGVLTASLLAGWWRRNNSFDSRATTRAWAGAEITDMGVFRPTTP